MKRYRYGAYFGKFRILSEKQDLEEAIIDIRKQWEGYKDGGDKKEHIRPHIYKDLLMSRDI